MIRKICQIGIDSIHDMIFVNTYSLYHPNKSPDNCLHTAEKEKKSKYLEACLQKCRHFYPSVFSVDNLLSVEVEATIKCIASRLVKKWKYPYSRRYVYEKSSVAITLVISTHRCIWGTGFRSTKSVSNACSGRTVSVSSSSDRQDAENQKTS